MEPALKLNVLIAHPSYGGNGGISSEHPDIREWEVETVQKMKRDPRIGEIKTKTIADTPITMVRNRFVTLAREAGAHLLLMVDSDQSPNKHRHEPWFKPFWDVAFDEIYSHYQQGPLVIGAPYCGPPGGGENIYVFQFDNRGYHDRESIVRLEQFTRPEAARMTGISEVAALPTGMILFDMRIFEISEPSGLKREQVIDQLLEGRMTRLEALAALNDGWFFYEWENQYADRKASTEDVASTRNMAFNCSAKYGYNPLRCAWDSWIGHWKPWNVGKPQMHSVENIAADFRFAIEEGISQDERMIDLPMPDLSEMHQAPPVPGDFPRDVLAQISVPLEVRNVFGHECVFYDHQTPAEHLAALRDIVREESDRRAEQLRIIEVGSWLGESAIALSQGAKEVVCVDNFSAPGEGDRQSEMLEGLGGAENVSRIFQYNTRNIPQIALFWADSTTAASEMHPHGADLIFLDAGHEYEDVLEDIYVWLQHLRPGGLMAGHDYLTVQFPGVKKAVHEVFGESAVQTVAEQCNGALWVVRVDDPQYLLKRGEAHVETA